MFVLKLHINLKKTNGGVRKEERRSEAGPLLCCLDFSKVIKVLLDLFFNANLQMMTNNSWMRNYSVSVGHYYV